MRINPQLRGFEPLEMEVRGSRVIVRNATDAPYMANDVKIEKIRPSILGANMSSMYKDYQVKNWVPYMTMHPVNEEKEDGSHYTTRQAQCQGK